MVAEDFKRKMEYNQYLAGDNDSNSTSNGEQPVGRLYSIEMKSTNSEQVIVDWIWGQNKCFSFIKF